MKANTFHALAVAAAVLAGCGSEGSMAPPQPGTATDTVHVSPDSLQLGIGEIATLTATLVDDEGHPVEGSAKVIVTGDVPPQPPPSTNRGFYVTPSGSGTACTMAQPCALAVALALAAYAGN